MEATDIHVLKIFLKFQNHSSLLSVILNINQLCYARLNKILAYTNGFSQKVRRNFIFLNFRHNLIITYNERNNKIILYYNNNE